MNQHQWIGVTEVAAELNITTRGAWELVRRLGVNIVEGEKKRMDRARFLRSDWETALAASMKPMASRIPARPSYVAANAPEPSVNAKPKPKVDKIARFRKL